MTSVFKEDFIVCLYVWPIQGWGFCDFKSCAAASCNLIKNEWNYNNNSDIRLLQRIIISKVGWVCPGEHSLHFGDVRQCDNTICAVN